MEEILTYVKPELLIVSVVLYLLGIAIKKSMLIKDKYIPLVLGGISILLCGIWVFANCNCSTAHQAALALFTTITQGILVAALSNYANQIVKQMQKVE